MAGQSELANLWVPGADFGKSLAPSTWKLAGLEMAQGTPVSDLRVKQRMGYWDGDSLTPNFADAMSRPMGDEQEERALAPESLTGYDILEFL
ncbi:hypothetical protein GCM10023155_19260 [Bremerella cremea]